MKVAHYDKLRGADLAAPRFLAILMMPRAKSEWLSLTADELICRRCVRWVSLRNAPAVDQGDKTVYIPEENLLTPDAFKDLATRTSKQEWVNYVP